MSRHNPVTLGLKPSFGFGDRIGLATPGHVAAMQAFGDGITPIYPQQSIREMERTGRTAEAVMRDAIQGAIAAGWTGDFGADADHLKTTADIDITASAGFVFFTIDPSDHVGEKADSYGMAELAAKFDEIKDSVDWLDQYHGRAEKLSTGLEVDFSEEVIMRCAVKYGAAIQYAVEMAAYIRQVQETAKRDYEIELSVDETEQPTTPAEHWIIAEQCLKKGMKLVSLAPRFIGQMEKGVDYIGDVAELEGSLNEHSAVAETLGPYKLSLHSGSDKLSMYPALARATRGRFHVKTAGTSYLEAVRVAAIEDPDFFRRLCEFARERYDADRATYHVHATFDTVTPPRLLPSAADLEHIYLENWDDVVEGRGFTEAGRQIMHCTYGSVLMHAEYAPRLRRCLQEHADTYIAVLKEHFGRHLRALKAGLPQK